MIATIYKSQWDSRRKADCDHADGPLLASKLCKQFSLEKLNHD